MKKLIFKFIKKMLIGREIHTVTGLDTIRVIKIDNIV
jgi:hypothetical protein